MSKTFNRVFDNMPKTHFGHACRNKRNIQSLKKANVEISKLLKGNG